MESLLDVIAREISKYLEEIEFHKHEIFRLRRLIRDLRWQAVEADEGEITHFDDID
jgi:hypothetical protein